MPVFSTKEFAEFNGYLVSAVDRGLSLEVAVDLLAAQAGRPARRTLLEAIAAGLREGKDLPVVLADHPDDFPPEYCALLSAGKESGRLSEVLRISRRQLDVQARLGVRFRRTSLYLWFLLALSFVVFAEVATIAWAHFDVINPFGGGGSSVYIFGVGRSEVKLLVWVSLAFGMTMVGAAITARILFNRGLKRGKGYWIPAWGRVLRCRDLGRWCTALALKTHAGAPLHDSLKAAEAAVLNPKFRASVERVTARVGEGVALSGEMYLDKAFPQTLTWALSLAESRGTLSATFETYAELYQADADRGFEALFLVLNPLGILMVGNIILLIAVAVLAPIMRFYRF